MAEKRKGGAQASPRKDVSPDEAPAKLLRKISPKTVMEPEKLGKLAPKVGEAEKHLFDVFGIATGLASGETQYGEYTSLTGMFEAVRHDGRRFEAATCFLPGAAGDILVGQMLASGVIPVKKKADGKTQAPAKDAPESAHVSVQFAVRVGMKYIEKRDGTDGYEFTTQEIVKLERADTLADLRAKALEFDG